MLHGKPWGITLFKRDTRTKILKKKQPRKAAKKFDVYPIRRTQGS